MSNMPKVRPFSIAIPGATLDDLRRRIGAARWPSRELVGDRSQGVQLATMQAPPTVDNPAARRQIGEFDLPEQHTSRQAGSHGHRRRQSDDLHDHPQPVP